MLSRSRLAVLIVVLILHNQVHAGRIVGGREAVPHSRPYMVFLERTTDNGAKYCGGFLLREDFMMTAAHCQAKNYSAWVGVHDTSSRNSNKCVQKISVEKAFPHQNYSSSTYKNDIMILKLTPKVKINPVVQTISLADQDDGSLPSSCSVSGWGTQDWNDPYITSRLMEVNVTLIDDKYNCSELKIYCSKENMGPGQGDSGGPLVCDGKAYGVVSTLYKNPLSNEIPLAIYTMIPEHKDWINSVIKKA